MIPLYDKWCINLEVTTKCGKACLYCSRYSRHLRPDMVKDIPVEKICEALDSYARFPGCIGISGGEPLLHDQWPVICYEIQKRFDRRKMVLFTARKDLLDQYRNIINATFETVCLNEHNEHQKAINLHQPATIAIGEAVPDAGIREQLIDECWVQRTWCGTVTEHGAYFCEIAANLDLILNDGANAWPVTDAWWACDVADFASQKHLCDKCGMAIPMTREPMAQEWEHITPKLCQEMQDRGLPLGKIKLFTTQFSRADIEAAIPTWYPGNYRCDISPDDCCGEGLGFRGQLK